jgi:hypothetical protein
MLQIELVFISSSKVQSNLQKLNVAQLVEKFNALYITWRYTAVLTESSHWTSTWTGWIQPKPTQPYFFKRRLPLKYPIWYLSVNFLGENFVSISHLTPGISKILVIWSSFIFDHRNNIRWIFSRFSCHPLTGPNIPLTTLLSGTLKCSWI